MYTSFLGSVKSALESLDADNLVSHYADNLVFADPAAGDDWSITSREELTLYFRRLFSLPDVKFEVASIFGCNGWAAAEWIWSGRKPDSGQSYRIEGASILELRDGRIVRETIYYDPRSGPS